MKSIKLIIILILPAVMLISGAQAMTWDEAMSLAAKNNHQIKSSQGQLDASQWSHYRSWTNFLPQISANASYSESVSSTESTTHSYSTGLTATQYLFRGFQNYYDLISASNDLDSSKANLKKTMSDVYFSVRQSFTDLYVAQQNVELSDQILARLKQNARLIKLQYDSGREDRGNYLTTAASQKDAEHNLASAKRDLYIAKLKLSQLLGIDVESAEGDLSSSMESVDDFESMLNNSPQYLIASYQLKSADISSQNTVSGYLPTISLSGSYSNNGQDWPPPYMRRSWSLNVSYSLFPGGSNIADSLIGGYNAEKAEQDFQSARNSILLSIEQAYNAAYDNIEALDVRTAQLEAATERAKISDAKYVDGLIAYDEWNRTINDYISAQKGALTQRKAALNAVAAWKNSYGGW